MRLAAVWFGLLIMLSGCTIDFASTDAKLAASPAPPQQTSVTVVMNGDLLWHNTLWYGATEDARRRGKGGYDFAPLLAGMKPVISSADLAICHEEVPLASPGGPYRNYPLFAAPPHVAKAISVAGYDVCTTASNHAVDQGFAGVRRTLDELDRAKIARTPAQLGPRPNPSVRRSSSPTRESRSGSSQPHSA
jgi:Bacterial capsule synthesis protein PGA_cap